ncbi:MAG: dephospho-CoA kinase [Rhodobacteraceae bacterium]|nr:dephospho-CoA kinase [Paracoccaceae bacterium]
MHRIGITGSIGMGKSTVAGLFAKAGVPVWDADQAVADLYRADGAGTRALRDILPQTLFAPSGIQRDALRRAVTGDRNLLSVVENIIHPLVREHRRTFLDQFRSLGTEIVVLEVPLLFESGIENEVDTVIVVTAPAAVQQARVLRERNLSRKEFQSLLERQMPDHEKRRKADHVVFSVDLNETEQQVCRILSTLRRRNVCGN